MTTKEFLQLVVTSERGYFCLSFKEISGEGWVNNWFSWPDDLDKIVALADANKNDYNVYFSSYLFSEKSKEKSYVVPSRTIQADLDEAEITYPNITLMPTITVETSPGRTQGYWILNNQLDLESHEILSRKLTYSIANSDHSGWPLGHIVRLPNTINHKYLDGPKPVTVYHLSGKTYDSQDVELLPDHSSVSAQADTEWLDKELTLPDIGPLELLENIKSRIPLSVYTQYGVLQKDRSAALFSLLCNAFRAGCTREEVYLLATKSANNKFEKLRYNGKRELAKDILRAEQVVNTKVSNIRQAILEARKLSGIAVEKRQYIYKLVLQTMESEGEFFHAMDDTLWYVRRDSGRPISIIERSNYLENLLDLQFGLNSTEVETAYVIAGLVSHVRSLPINARVSALSYYNPETNTVLIHTGRKDVMVITKNSISTVTNGSFGILFLWDVSTEVFVPSFNSEPWHETLYGECLDNLVDVSREDAMTLLRTWTFFLLMRNDAIARPILALFGQPGSGKSTLFRRVYALLYGRNRSVGSVTTAEDFDFSVISDPLVVLDNVDTWEKWLPDRLALSASTSDVTRRQLYKNSDVIKLKRQAMVGITAHNPKFGREDVADRFILFNFERLKDEKRIPEGAIINAIISQRNKLWGSIAKDIQKILACDDSNVDYENAPTFRIEDFAHIGYRIAAGLEVKDSFREAIKNISKKQKDFNLDEDHILVTGLQTIVSRRPSNDFKTCDTLWSELENACADPLTFRRLYGNTIKLGKKLWSLHDSLRSVFNIDWKTDPIRATRTWRITKKDEDNITISR